MTPSNGAFGPAACHLAQACTSGATSLPGTSAEVEVLLRRGPGFLGLRPGFSLHRGVPRRLAVAAAALTCGLGERVRFLIAPVGYYYDDIIRRIIMMILLGILLGPLLRLLL